VYEASVWSNADGRKIYRYFARESDAKAWRGEAGTAVKHQKLRAPTSQTLREASAAWLDAADRGEVRSRNRKPYKPSTLRTYRRDFEVYVWPDLGGRKLSAVTFDDLQTLVDRLLRAGLSGSKVRNVIVPLQALYRRHHPTFP
jgi:hypothetical protein